MVITFILSRSVRCYYCTAVLKGVIIFWCDQKYKLTFAIIAQYTSDAKGAMVG